MSKVCSLCIVNVIAFVNVNKGMSFYLQFKHTVKWREVSDNVLDCCHLASSEFNFRFQRRGQMLNLERRQIPNFTFITVLQKPIFTLLRAATILENCQFIEQIYYNKSKKLLVPFCFLFHSSVCLFVWIICCHIKKTIKADGKMVMAIFKSSLKNLLTYSLLETLFRSENYLVCIDTHTFILTS